jgi:hypothetical protein
MQPLVIATQPPERWYNAEGGKENSLLCVVAWQGRLARDLPVRGCFGRPFCAWTAGHRRNGAAARVSAGVGLAPHIVHRLLCAGCALKAPG